MVSKTEFNALPWHDAVLLELKVDREKPGSNDTVLVVIRWPSGSESQVYFDNCYYFSAQMNFGVISEESILEAECTADDEELPKIREKWSPLGVELDSLLCYRICTNTTNSQVKIYALSMRVE